MTNMRLNRHLIPGSMISRIVLLLASTLLFCALPLGAMESSDSEEEVLELATEQAQSGWGLGSFLSSQLEGARELLRYGANATTDLYYQINPPNQETVDEIEAATEYDQMMARERQRKIREIEDLLASGADIETRIEESFHGSLSEAIEEGCKFRQFIQRREDAERNVFTLRFPGNQANNFTCLHRVAGIGCIDLVQRLLTRKANTEARDKNGLTPLFWAAAHGHHEVFNLLQAHGAAIEAKTDDGDSVLHFLLHGLSCGRNSHNWGSRVSLAKHLIETWPDLNEKNGNDETPLHVAAHGNYYKQDELLWLLLSHGSHITARNQHGFTALHVVHASGLLSCRMLFYNIWRDFIREQQEVNVKTSRARLIAALIIFNRNRLPKDAQFVILASLVDLKKDAALVILSELAQGRLINPQSVLARREFSSDSACCIFENLEPLLNEIHEAKMPTSSDDMHEMSKALEDKNYGRLLPVSDLFRPATRKDVAVALIQEGINHQIQGLLQQASAIAHPVAEDCDVKD